MSGAAAIATWFAKKPIPRLRGGAIDPASPPSFLYWARNTRKVRGLEIPSGTTQSHATFGNNERLQARRHVLLDDHLNLPWRIGGALVLLFGQPAERMGGLTIGRVKVESDERVLLNPAGDWIDVPEPLAASEPVRSESSWLMAATPLRPWSRS